VGGILLKRFALRIEGLKYLEMGQVEMAVFDGKSEVKLL